MDLITSKELIIEQVNKLINSYQENEKINSEKYRTITNDITITHEMNTKLMKEIEEKDKLILLSEKKCYDYEVMINKIQDEANKELDEKTKHDMIRAKDKEIFNCENEIKRLQKQVNDLTEKLNQKENENETISKELEDSWKNESRNSIVNDEAKVAIAVQGYMQHTGLKIVTDKEVGQTSIGLDGWYKDTVNINKKKTLVEKMKEVSEEQDDEWIHVTGDNFHAIVTEYAHKNEINIAQAELLTLHMKSNFHTFQLPVKEMERYFKELRLNNELENPVVSEVVEEVEEDKGETTEELSDVDENKGENKKEKVEESTDEEECTVTTIKHYGKEYYIVDGEDPQYIYAIEDGELGDVKGIMKNGKKQMYKK
jgi:hypothetical protein